MSFYDAARILVSKNTKVMKGPFAIILDDHQLFADSFSLMLEQYNLFEQVHTLYATADFPNLLISLGRKDVYIFLDYYLGDKNGLSVLAEIKRLHKNVRVIFITAATSPTVIQNIMLSKPHGLISKHSDLPTLIECIEHKSTKSVFTDSYTRSLLKDQQPLKSTFTVRELELLQHFANGLSIADTAKKISLSIHTIVAHRRKMMAKANCNSIGQLIKYAQDYEFI
ncbi:response regulator transcription factor [Sphingobacterium wenxiniae]|uniref:DNA-binding response regulator, NarL/FixJ family, contains REC and HTH domains n=1 Tax=Sphingobacterium wenxiniae TaxID=683125 RepID=A0A1I6SUG6_9SPHI|nr:response regulator transcription factor [Sphingobacterium wenxiniae]SFS80518.1 DNA-binding response regulator, NarL/FixJ family, contains REC and HTH domains [Sphingobacterium wenxiniae]